MVFPTKGVLLSCENPSNDIYFFLPIKNQFKYSLSCFTTSQEMSPYFTVKSIPSACALRSDFPHHTSSFPFQTILDVPARSTSSTDERDASLTVSDSVRTSSFTVKRKHSTVGTRKEKKKNPTFEQINFTGVKSSQ